MLGGKIRHKMLFIQTLLNTKMHMFCKTAYQLLLLDSRHRTKMDEGSKFHFIEYFQNFRN